jgi:serine O-acetyltransferase
VNTYTDEAAEVPTAAEPASSESPKLDFWEVLRHDCYRYRASASTKTLLKTYLRNPPFRFTFWLRAARHFMLRSGPLAKFGYYFCRFIREHYSLKYGYQILEHTEIGPGFYIGHVGPLVVNYRARIGRNVNIAIGVTIGQANRGKFEGAPTLGNRVWVGTNAIVVGKITIGDGALIAPGAYVNFDVPPNAVVMGNPAKIVSTGGTAGYVENTLTD